MDGNSKCSSIPLRSIDEDEQAPLPAATSEFPKSFPVAPETPIEPMEFLAGPWSLSALQVSTALSNALMQTALSTENADQIDGSTKKVSTEYNQQCFCSKRDVSQCQGSLQLLPTTADKTLGGNPPPSSAVVSEDLKEWLLLDQVLNPDFLCNGQLLSNGFWESLLRGKSVGRWLKDQKEKKKEEVRTHKAQMHAAVSVAGVAAAIAAIAAATATSTANRAEETNARSKTSSAVASAAALVASHCIDIAEGLGAHRDQMYSVVNSAVNVKTAGDIMTLTAGAATALRGAATFRARLHRGGGTTAAGQEPESCKAMNFVSQGGELLKRTRKGVLHWKQVSLHINSNSQVVVKLKSRHMAGTFVKKKKSIVSDICCNIPAWPGREREDSGHRAYFGIKIPGRIVEFECKNNKEKQMWIEGIRQMLIFCTDERILPCHFNK